MKSRITALLLSTVALFGALVGTSSAQATDAAPAVQEEKSLYDRLGGVYAIGTVVDAFLERLLVNDTLNANPVVEAARHRVPTPGLKFQVTMLVCQVTGGPYAYKGRSMKDTHAPLNITEGEWVAMAADFKATLDQFEVPEAEQQELFAIVGTTKADIVVDAPTGVPVDASAIFPQEDTTLYGRLGGVYNIATVVDDFIERVLVNDTINANPVVEASRARVPKAGLKTQVTALMCQVTGGPYEYNGRSMKDSHAELGISESQWAAMAADFKATLDAFKVPAAEQEELFAIVGTTKADIVTVTD